MLIEKRVTHPGAWTSFSDVGKSVTLDEYLRVESNTIATAIELLRDAGVSGLRIEGLENPAEAAIPYREGMRLSLDALEEAFRRVLREEFWCRFEDDSGAFVHFGYDYYMYVGVPSISPRAQQRGLVVEDFPSPYRDR